MNINVPLWAAFAVFAGAIAFASAQEWAAGRYEITRCGRFRFAVTRRWYGTGAHVCLKGEEDATDPHRLLVTILDGEETEVPWLRVRDIDDEDAKPFYAPVTCFAPYTVRRFRPYILHVGRVPVPQLTRYLPLRSPSGHLEDVRDAA